MGEPRAETPEQGGSRGDRGRANRQGVTARRRGTPAGPGLGAPGAQTAPRGLSGQLWPLQLEVRLQSGGMPGRRRPGRGPAQHPGGEWRWRRSEDWPRTHSRPKPELLEPSGWTQKGREGGPSRDGASRRRGWRKHEVGGLAGDTGHECQGVGKPRSRDRRVLGDTRVPDEGYLEQVESGSSVYGDKQQHRGQGASWKADILACSPL